jgi:hypothetical protein
MIQFDEGKPTLCGRVTCGTMAGYITHIDRETYRVRWLDGAETTQLRPDVDDEIQYAEAAE